jgi:voltage-gated potassium channel
LRFVRVAGTAGYHYIEGWSGFDGFYMVVTTLTTIGCQESIRSRKPDASSTRLSF